MNESSSVAAVESAHKTCMVCMDSFDSDGDGICCPSGHFICQNDCISYLAENVFPAVFRMRESRCAIPCPSENCPCAFNPLRVFQRMPAREKARYRSIMDDVISNNYNLQMLRSAILDVMTLKCPTCTVPVDPFPDACSAVMCLNCGNHYCNYCFMAFTTGVAAHEHVASHSTSDKPECRDAFLSSELVAVGQRLHQIEQLGKCVSLALSSPEYGPDGGHDVSIALIMCYSEITDLNIDVVQLLIVAENLVMTGFASRPLDCCISPIKSPKKGERNERNERNEGRRVRRNGSFLLSASSDEFDVADDTELDEAVVPTHIDPATVIQEDQRMPPPSTLTAPLPGRGNIRDAMRDARRNVFQAPEGVQRQGAAQLANALITYNTEAAVQIMHTYQGRRFDVDFTDMKHGHPLCSLALITGQTDIALKLLELGADPLKPNASGRTILYMAAEAGLEDVIHCILQLHPELDLNAPVTSELQRYSLIHVAARYNHGHLIRYLAPLGVDLNQEESEHCYSPLTLSLVLGHCWAASELMHAGAAVRVVTTNGRTPMFVAAEKGLSEMIRIMIEDCHIDVNEPVVLPSGLRLIHVAAFHRQAQTVSQLIGMGADVNIVDDEGGYNPLTMAIIGGNISSALTIIGAGADVRAQSQSGRLPIYIAVEKGLTEVVRTLITECGIGVNERTTSEVSAVTPLHVAVLHGQSHLIPMLIALGADVDMLDQEKHCCPLIAAIILQDEWSVQLLIEAKANANRMSREGRGPMYIAAEKDSASILRMLVEKCGIDVDAPATNELDKGSPLHVAAMFDNASSVSVLLQMGADVFTRDALGRTAEEIARNAFSRKAHDVLKHHIKKLNLINPHIVSGTVSGVGVVSEVEEVEVVCSDEEGSTDQSDTSTSLSLPTVDHSVEGEREEGEGSVESGGSEQGEGDVAEMGRGESGGRGERGERSNRGERTEEGEDKTERAEDMDDSCSSQITESEIHGLESESRVHNCNIRGPYNISSHLFCTCRAMNKNNHISSNKGRPPL